VKWHGNEEMKWYGKKSGETREISKGSRVFVRLCQMATYLYNKKFHRNKTVTFDWLLLLHNHCHSYK
jgi:hypothetical protein